MSDALGGVYTFSGVVENHVGMQKVGKIRDAFTSADLVVLSNWFNARGALAHIIDLKDDIPKDFRSTFNSGHVLMIRQGVHALGVDPVDLFAEFKGARPDTKYFDQRRQRVLNKNARYNFNVGEEAQEANYPEGKGTIHPFGQMPVLAQVRAKIGEIVSPQDHPALFSKLSGLLAEANVYHSEKSGIGFHGDAERNIVLGANMGESRRLEFQGFLDNFPVGNRRVFRIKHGDMYAMGDTATGHNWSASQYRTPHYRHRAGYDGWLDADEKANQKKWGKRAA